MANAGRSGLVRESVGLLIRVRIATPLGDFAHFHEIILATWPSAAAGSLGPVIGTVGLIGTGLINVMHAGAPIPFCAIITLASATDGVQIEYEAFDPEGDLYSYAVTAEYGHGLSATIYQDSYTPHANPAHNWQGLTDDTKPVPPAVWVAPVTCAYLFRISAWTRTTNGYQFPVIGTSDFQTVTLIKPGVVFRPLPLSGPARVAAKGFDQPVPTPNAVRQPLKILPVTP